MGGEGKGKKRKTDAPPPPPPPPLPVPILSTSEEDEALLLPPIASPKKKGKKEEEEEEEEEEVEGGKKKGKEMEKGEEEEEVEWWVGEGLPPPSLQVGQAVYVKLRWMCGGTKGRVGWVGGWVEGLVFLCLLFHPPTYSSSFEPPFLLTHPLTSRRTRPHYRHPQEGEEGRGRGGEEENSPTHPPTHPPTHLSI